MPYARGDYARGDPGIGGALGRIAGRVASQVGGLAPGPSGAALRAMGSALAGGRGGTMKPMMGPLFTGEGGAPLGGLMFGMPGTALVAHGACGLKGHHLNKRGYWRKQKGLGRLAPGAAQWIAPHSICVRNRRMNPGNVRALRKSMRRATAFARVARRVMTFTLHHKVKKHPR